MGRERGGGFRMGNACIPVVDSFQYLAKKRILQFVVIHTVKSFGIISETEIDVFSGILLLFL